MAGEKLVSIMLRAGGDANPSSERTDLIYGKVVSTSPLKVQIENEPKMILSEAFLILSPFCKAKSLSIPAWNTESASGHTHNISTHVVQVWRGLAVGDKVLMLRIHQGNMFYILQREGDL